MRRVLAANDFFWSADGRHSRAYRHKKIGCKARIGLARFGRTVTVLQRKPRLRSRQGIRSERREYEPRGQCARRKGSRATFIDADRPALLCGRCSARPCWSRGSQHALSRLTLSVPPELAGGSRTSSPRGKEGDRHGLWDRDSPGPLLGCRIRRTPGLIRRAEKLRRNQGQDEHQQRGSLHVRSPDKANGSVRDTSNYQTVTTSANLQAIQRF